MPIVFCQFSRLTSTVVGPGDNPDGGGPGSYCPAPLVNTGTPLSRGPLALCCDQFAMLPATSVRGRGYSDMVYITVQKPAIFSLHLSGTRRVMVFFTIPSNVFWLHKKRMGFSPYVGIAGNLRSSVGNYDRHRLGSHLPTSRSRTVVFMVIRYIPFPLPCIDS